MIRSDHLKQALFNSEHSLRYLYTTRLLPSLPRVRVLYVYCAIVILHLLARQWGQLKVTFFCWNGNFRNANWAGTNEHETTTTTSVDLRAMVKYKKKIPFPSSRGSSLRHINIITFFLILFDSRLQHSDEIFASPLDPFITPRSSRRKVGKKES